MDPDRQLAIDTHRPARSSKAQIISNPTTAASTTWKHDLIIMEDTSADHIINYSTDNSHHSQIISNGKKVLTEMNFFADSKHKPSAAVDHVVKKETKVDDDVLEHQNEQYIGLNLLTGSLVSNKFMVNDGTTQNKEDYNQRKKELEVLQAEINSINLENQRLRGMISQVNSSYYALQNHLSALMQKTETAKKHEEFVDGKHGKSSIVARQFLDPGKAEDQMVELKNDNSNSQQSTSEERCRDCSISPNIVESMEININNSLMNNTSNTVNGVSSSADHHFHSSDEAFHRWIPNKIPKFNSSKDVDQEHKEETMSMIRKARVSVRAISDASTISDGCQWRKYGQKLAKGNPCPRAYYRCTMASGCPVRKQVQRSAEDRAVLVTTYEGYHNHPLPPAAMAMASTTSAAASMLLSGSTSSSDGLINTNLLPKTIPYSCPPGFASLSALAPFPTVTLDLTHPSTISNSSQTTQHHQSHFPASSHISGDALYNQAKFSSGPFSPHQGIMELQPQMSENVSAATAAAITGDPNFTSALVAAIASIIGNVHANNSNSSSPTVKNSLDSDT